MLVRFMLPITESIITAKAKDKSSTRNSKIELRLRRKMPCHARVHRSRFIQSPLFLSVFCFTLV